jgi:hypothetical protein
MLDPPQLLGKFNGLSELPSLDAELYKNLMFLKAYEVHSTTQ